MPLLCEKRGHVAILTLSRPKARNAWDEDFNDGLEARLAELEHSPSPYSRKPGCCCPQSTRLQKDPCVRGAVSFGVDFRRFRKERSGCGP